MNHCVVIIMLCTENDRYLVSKFAFGSNYYRMENVI